MIQRVATESSIQFMLNSSSASVQRKKCDHTKKSTHSLQIMVYRQKGQTCNATHKARSRNYKVRKNRTNPRAPPKVQFFECPRVTIRANTPFRPHPYCLGKINKGIRVIREYKSPTPVKLYIHFTFIEDLQ